MEDTFPEEISAAISEKAENDDYNVSALHDRISEFADIVGVAVEWAAVENELGEYSIEPSVRIDYEAEPTEEQLALASSLIDEWPLENEKINRISAIDESWEKTIASGWETPYGWRLGMTTQDVALLNGNFTLAKEAENLGVSSPIFVVDADGVSHEMFLQDLTVLMLQYGQARASLSAEYAAKKKAIVDATSIDDLP
jgi:hypothetical protein